MNLLENVKIVTLWTSTAVSVGSTGNGGSSGSFGANAFVSTGIDTAGYGGVLFVSNVANSSVSQLSAAFASASTIAAGSWTALNSSATISGSGASTVFETLALDIPSHTQRYLAAAVGVPTTSGVLLSIHAILYGPTYAPVTGTSTAYFVLGAKTAPGTTA